MKEKRKQLLNAAWYVFIILIVGQIGPLIEYAKALWDGSSVLDKIEESAAKGELLTCAIAILAAGTYFLVKEYNSPAQIGNRIMKSSLLLWTILCGFGCVLISVQLLSASSSVFGAPLQRWLHWVCYGFAMITAFALWMLEEWQTSASEETGKWERNASSMTTESERVKTSTGLRV
ncbi:hypothetical protein [Burkholderia sp. Cy-647]|nr:hypothetical protein [Burkholderia sp. Cy-647]